MKLSAIRPGLCLTGLLLIISACANTPAATAVTSTQAAVGNSSVSPVKNSAAVTATSVTPAAKEPIAAVINNQTITLAVLDRQVARELEGKKAVGDPAPADMNAFRLTVLDSLIQEILIEQAAGIQNVVITDTDVETEVQTEIKIAGSKDNWLAQVTANKLTEQEFRANIKSTLIAQKMRDIVTKSSCVNVEQVHARHILVTDEKIAQQIKTQIDAGTDFAKLAAQYSLDVTTKQTGGDLGWFARGQLLQKAVEDAAFSLTNNQVSAPVKSDLGYHIIQTLERVKDRPVDVDTCARLTQRDFELWIQGLVSKAHIEKYPNGKA